jgi:hypothetical protein
MIGPFAPSTRCLFAASFATLSILSPCALTHAAKPPTSAPASSKPATDTREQALSLLQKHDAYRAKFQSYACTEEITNDSQTKTVDPKVAGWNGTSKRIFRTDYRFDGTRYSVAMSFWGNIDSPQVFVPEAKRITQYYLWDGKEYLFNCIDTRFTQEQGLEIMALPASWEIIGRNIAEPAKDPAKADKLSVRATLETVGSAKCYVVDSETKYFEEKANPPRFYTVQETRWLDPDRGYNMVKARHVRKDDTGFSDSTNLDDILCKQIDDLWVPMEANRRKYMAFPNGDYMRMTSRIKTTSFTFNPDHKALGSFVPHFSNGLHVVLNPEHGKGYTLEQTPIWQDGRLLDPQGHVLLDCPPNLDLPQPQTNPSP